MKNMWFIYVLSIAIIAKGEPQQRQLLSLQEGFNQLTAQPNRVHPTTEKSALVDQQTTAGESFKPIFFPTQQETQRPIDIIASQQTQLQQQHPQQQQQNALDPYLNQGQIVAPKPIRAMPPSIASANSKGGIDRFDYIRDFSWKLFQNSKIPSAIGNLIISPIQPQLLLSLLRTAADGLTEEEIANALNETDSRLISDLVSHLKHETSSHSELGIANSIFVSEKYNLNNSFIKEALSRDVEMFPVDFGNIDDAAFIINTWISNATKSQISSLYNPERNRDIKLVLANTIYFRGEWKFGFNQTAQEPFETTEKLHKNVPMMRNTARLRSAIMRLAGDVRGQWVELPYLSENFSMIIILPEQRHRLDELIRALQPSDFKEIFDQLTRPYKKIVHVSLPKFTVQTTFSMVNTLLKMRIVDLFTSSSRLPYLASSAAQEPLRVDDILQQSILSVDQKGTVAASATISHVITLSLNSAPEEVFFNVNEPFLSVIVDKRNQIPLFIGKIFNP